MSHSPFRVAAEVWNLFTVGDGRTQRWELFFTRDQALAVFKVGAWHRF